MAITNVNVSSIVLDLPGLGTGGLRSATLPALAFADSAPPALGRFEAELQPGLSPQLLPWAMSLARDGGTEQAGALLEADVNRKLVRRLDWTGGSVTMLAFSPLDARVARQSFSLLLQWEVQTLKSNPGGGQQMPASPGKSKAWLTSNFKVDGLPFDSRGVSRVELPTVTLLPHSRGSGRSQVTALLPVLSNWQLQVAGPGLAPALAWVNKLADQGGVKPDNRFDLDIALMDTSLKTVLGNVTLKGCSLVRSQESALGSTDANALRTLTLVFSAQSLDLRASGK